MIYTDGTIAIKAGSPIVTGTGTQWKKNIHGVAPGQLISIENGTAPVSMMIRAVNSDTELVLSFNAPVTLSGAKYSIATTVPDTISDAARTMSANQGYIVYFLQAMQQWMTDTGKVEIELPNGQKVTLDSIKAMNEAIANAKPGDATTTQKGIVQLSASVGTSTTKVPHEKAVSDALAKKAGTNRFIESGNETQVKNAGGDYFRMTSGGYAGAVNKDGELIFEFTPDGTMNAGLVPFACGGTGAKNKAGALKNLGLESALLLNPDNISVKSNLNNYTAPGAYAFTNDAVGSNFPDSWGGNLYVDKDPIYSGRGWQTYRVYATTDIYRRSPKASDQWTSWVKEWNTGNAKPDTNGWLKVSSPIIEIYPSGHFETNDESAGAEVSRTGTGQYHITGILGYNSDGAWGVNGGVSVPKDNNGLELVYVDDRVQKDGSIIIETCHRQHAHLPERFQNWRLKEITPEGERIFYQDGEPCDLPESTRLDVRVEMPQGSVWNEKQRELAEQMEREQAEREAQEAAEQAGDTVE